MPRILLLPLFGAVLLVSLGSTGQADQTDRRLDALFETLKTTADRATAQTTQAEIWHRVFRNALRLIVLPTPDSSRETRLAFVDVICPIFIVKFFLLSS